MKSQTSPAIAEEVHLRRRLASLYIDAIWLLEALRDRRCSLQLKIVRHRFLLIHPANPVVSKEDDGEEQVNRQAEEKERASSNSYAGAVFDPVHPYLLCRTI